MQIIIQPSYPLTEALDIPRGITSLVGGGGKTTLMFRLAGELSRAHKVIVATTTHVMRPDNMPVLTDPSLDDIHRALAHSNAVFAGRVASHDKMTAAGVDAEQMSQIADYVLIEADGAKGRPLKAPAFYEPVIPVGTALVIAVAGMDGLHRPICDAAHRPALFAKALGADETHATTPAELARMLVADDGQRRGVTEAMRFSIVLNKADDDLRLGYARECAAHIDPARAERVLIVSLNKEAASC